jgi:Ca-activated chloride channel family protein
MKTLTLFLMVFFPVWVCGQSNINTISGYVYQSSDKTPLPGVAVQVKNNPKQRTLTNAKGYFTITLSANENVLTFSFLGFKKQEVVIKKQSSIKVYLEEDSNTLDEVVVIGYGVQNKMSMTGAVSISGKAAGMASQHYMMNHHAPQDFNTESYSAISENGFKTSLSNPLSTFSIDVDAASYSNMRRFIQNGQLPPKDAVRIEELINYFQYPYAAPKGKHPIHIQTEITTAPWNKKHQLVKIGLKAKPIESDNLPAANLVFLIDVSGSMQGSDRLGLLKTAFKLLTDQLREQDKVSIVVYAGAAGVVLPSTSGDDKTKIKAALEQLEAGGSTAGGAGIKKAYQIARSQFIKGGNNRVILATDGDFNVGASSDTEMQRLIEENRNYGVFLTVLGFGMGNLKDSKMEALADKGNGNYAYIDNMNEAKKVLVNEFGSTLFTIAKDVKLQVEFNPLKVKAYRLIGYENRLLNKEDFADDTKDAGDMGAGHSVTALYEVIPVGVQSAFVKKDDDLKYQQAGSIKNSAELLTVNVRYKNPGNEESILLSHPFIADHTHLEKASADLKFAAAIATFGMYLRNSEYLQDFNFADLLTLAKAGKGDDKEGYRAEFIQLIENARLIKSSKE